MSLSSTLKRIATNKPLRRSSGDGESEDRPIGGGGSLVSARKIELSGQWGQVFGPLDLDIDRGGLNLIAAPPGAARTAFLMAICGRMKLKSGRLTVLGHTNDPHAVFKESNIACFDELDGPQPSVTVQDLITEQTRWESGFFKWVPLATTEDLRNMCGYLFEGLALPPIDAFIADLPELHQLLLRVGVANTKRPPLLVVGRLDAMSDEDQQGELLDRLISLGEKQSVIAADVNASDFEDKVSEVIEVPGLYEFQQRSTPAKDLAKESNLASHALKKPEQPGEKPEQSAEGADSGDDFEDETEVLNTEPINRPLDSEEPRSEKPGSEKSDPDKGGKP